MYHIGPVKQLLYGHELRWVDKYKYLGYYIRSDFIDDRDLIAYVKQEQYIVEATLLFMSFQPVQWMLRTGSLDFILVVCTVAHYAIVEFFYWYF